MRFVASAAACVLTAMLVAQAPTPPTSTPPPAPVSDTPAPQPPPDPRAKTRLDYAGKPMRVGFRCADEDIQPLGLSCSASDPCPVYLELAALETVGAKLFVTGNIHTSAVTFASILLASEDGGKSWWEPVERVRSAGLEQIQFIDFETGWAAGQLLQTLPRDPFLLLTTDGGNSWRRRPIFDESRIGTVEQFWFESKTSGVLLIDRGQSGETGARHEMFESMTGGESWTIREVSARPIRLKRSRPPVANEDWRLRPDGPSKSYRIERRQGQRWQTIASFLVTIGECVPPEPPSDTQAEAPPPEPSTPAPPPTPAPARKTPPTLKKQRP